MAAERFEAGLRWMAEQERQRPVLTIIGGPSLLPIAEPALSHHDLDCLADLAAAVREEGHGAGCSYLHRSELEVAMRARRFLVALDAVAGRG